MSVSYEYDEGSASQADNVANRIEQGPYVGQFKVVHAITAQSGTEGMHFEFESGGGNVGFDLYTRKSDGSKVFGMNLVQAIMSIMGLRGLKSVSGEHEAWVDGKRETVEGEVFPDLAGKDIGLVFQKELYTKGDGRDGQRMNLYAVFHPTSRLMVSEIKEHKVKPEKLEKTLKGLKVKDTRKAAAAEPSQPSVGAEGGY